MDVFVEQPVVQQQVAVVEPDVVAEHADLGIELDMSRYNVDISRYCQLLQLSKLPLHMFIARQICFVAM